MATRLVMVKPYLWYVARVLFAFRVPADNDRDPRYMEQALAAIHQANPRRLPITLLLNQHEGYTGLSLKCPEELVAAAKGQLYAAYPNARLERIGEDVSNAAGTPPLTWELFLEPDLLPIKRYSQFEDSLARVSADPLTALLATLSQSSRSPVQARIEIELRPCANRMQEKSRRIVRRLASPFFHRHHRLAEWYLHSIRSRSLFRRLAAALVGLYGREASLSHHDAVLETSTTRTHEREERLQAAADKLGRLLFSVRIRLVAIAPEEKQKEAEQILLSIAGAFGLFTGAGLARFHVGSMKPGKATHSFLLSSEEAATLWHAPTQTVQAERMAIVESRELEPPVNLPTERLRPGSPILGETSYRSRRLRFGILPDDRRRHILVEGKTGMGKTTLLQQLLFADLRGADGVCLIDPHGDLADSILTLVPARRTNDVLLFDLSDTGHPLAFNVLHCRHPSERPLVASGVLSAFKKIYGESWGPRLEHIMRNCLLTLVEVPDASLLSVLRILTDGAYRRSVLAQVSDPVVQSFWQHEFASWPAKFQAEAIAPIQNKVGHFVSSPILRNVLGQTRSTLDLRRVMDEGKILIVNLSKGKIGDDASSLLGSLLVTSLQLAAMSRAQLAETDRRDFHLFVDEFQNFATDSFSTILSEARKYRLSLTLANQYLAQMEEATLAAVLGNVGTLISFQVGTQDAPVLAEQLGMEVQPQDLLKLPKYHAYVRLLIDGQPSRPFSMRTLRPSRSLEDAHRASIIRRYSRQRYGRPVNQVEHEIAAAMSA